MNIIGLILGLALSGYIIYLGDKCTKLKKLRDPNASNSGGIISTIYELVREARRKRREKEENEKKEDQSNDG